MNNTAFTVNAVNVIQISALADLNLAPTTPADATHKQVTDLVFTGANPIVGATYTVVIDGQRFNAVGGTAADAANGIDATLTWSDLFAAFKKLIENRLQSVKSGDTTPTAYIQVSSSGATLILTARDNNVAFRVNSVSVAPRRHRRRCHRHDAHGPRRRRGPGQQRGLCLRHPQDWRPRGRHHQRHLVPCRGRRGWGHHHLGVRARRAPHRHQWLFRHHPRRYRDSHRHSGHRPQAHPHRRRGGHRVHGDRRQSHPPRPPSPTAALSPTAAGTSQSQVNEVTFNGALAITTGNHYSVTINGTKTFSVEVGVDGVTTTWASVLGALVDAINDDGALPLTAAIKNGDANTYTLVLTAKVANTTPPFTVSSAEVVFEETVTVPGVPPVFDRGDAGTAVKQESTLTFTGTANALNRYTVILNGNATTTYAVKPGDTVNSHVVTADWDDILNSLASLISAGPVATATHVNGTLVLTLKGKSFNVSFTVTAQTENTAITSGTASSLYDGDYVLILPTRNNANFGLNVTGQLTVVSLPTINSATSLPLFSGETINLTAGYNKTTGNGLPLIAGKNLVIVDALNVGTGTVQLRAGGSIAIGGTVTAGLLTVEAGNDLTLTTAVQNLEATINGAGSSLTINQTGNLAINSLVMNGGDLTIVATGSVTISAISGSIGRITIYAGGNVTVVNNTATAGDVTIVSAGSISAALEADTLDLTANGAISITETNGVVLSSLVQNNPAAAFSLVSGGDITVETPIALTGAASVTLTANGAGSDLVINSEISTASGAIALTAGGRLAFGETARLTSASGNITLIAGGALDLAGYTVVNAGSGRLALTAGGDITLGKLATTRVGDLTITSTAGAILDGGEGNRDIVAPNANLVLRAATGLGTADDAIEIQVASLDAINTTSGAVDLEEADALVITRLQQGSIGAGAVTVTTLDGGLTLNGSGLTAVNGDVSLRAPWRLLLPPPRGGSLGHHRGQRHALRRLGRCHLCGRHQHPRRHHRHRPPRLPPQRPRRRRLACGGRRLQPAARLGDWRGALRHQPGHRLHRGFRRHSRRGAGPPRQRHPALRAAPSSRRVRYHPSRPRPDRRADRRPPIQPALPPHSRAKATVSSSSRQPVYIFTAADIVVESESVGGSGHQGRHHRHRFPSAAARSSPRRSTPAARTSPLWPTTLPSARRSPAPAPTCSCGRAAATSRSTSATSARRSPDSHIDNTELAYIQNGFHEIQIGSPEGSYTIYVGDSATTTGQIYVYDPLRLTNQAAGGHIYIDDDLIGQDDAYLIIRGSGATTTIARISVFPSGIDLGDSIIVSGSRTLSAPAGSLIIGAAHSPAYALNGDGDATTTDALTISAADDVTFLNVIGNTDPLRGLTITRGAKRHLRPSMSPSPAISSSTPPAPSRSTVTSTSTAAASSSAGPPR